MMVVRLLLMFGPHVLIPWCLSLLFRARKNLVWFTYPITAVLIFFYPFLLFIIMDYIDPPPPGFRCGEPYAAMFIANAIVFLPGALLIQFIFNKIYGLHKRKASSTPNL
jgi:hypothetical protein